jgi:hypothetical protein
MIFMQEHDTNDQYNVSANVISNGTPPEWEDIPPDIIMATVKKLKPELLEGKGLRPFYKSYNSWEKMTAEQHDKAISWFRRLPANITRFVPLFLFYFSFANLILIPLIPFLTAVAVLHQSRVDATNVANEVTTASGNNTKDDIACLIHLYKYPGAQMHWTNYYGVLSRAQLDARRSTGVQADAANALCCLAAPDQQQRKFFMSPVRMNGLI